MFWIQKLSLFLINMCKSTSWASGDTSEILPLNVDAITARACAHCEPFPEFLSANSLKDGRTAVNKRSRESLIWLHLTFTTVVI